MQVGPLHFVTPLSKCRLLSAWRKDTSFSHRGASKTPNERTPRRRSASAHKAGHSSPQRGGGKLSLLGATSPPPAHITSAAVPPHDAQARQRGGRQDRAPSPTRNAPRAASDSSDPPRFRASRRGGVCMRRHTGGLESSRGGGGEGRSL